MTGTLQPLNRSFAIVDSNGQPTDYFVRWSQQKQQDIAGSVSTSTRVIAGAGLSGGGPLSASVTLTLNAGLDDLNDVTIAAPTSGQTLVYNGTSWVNDNVNGLPTGGTINQVLTKNSSTDGDASWATPHYVPAGGSSGQVLTKSSGTDYDLGWTTPSGGGGSGAGFPSNAWTAITWSGSSTTINGITACFPSTVTVTPGIGSQFELEVFLHRTRDADSAILLSDGTSAFVIAHQTDNNIVLYRYSGTTQTSMIATGAAAANDFTSWVKYKLLIKRSGTADYSIRAYVDDALVSSSSYTSYTTTTAFTLGASTMYYKGATSGSATPIGRYRLLASTDTPTG